MRTPEEIDTPLWVWRELGIYLEYLLNYNGEGVPPEFRDYPKPHAINAARDFYTCVANNNNAVWVFRGNNIDDLLILETSTLPYKITQWKESAQTYAMVPNFMKVIQH